MLTKLGIFLRKLRIDHNEILKNMADKLGVSVSFLSAVETGKKKMPSEWNRTICCIYQLNPQQIQEFTSAIAETAKTIEFNFAHANTTQKQLAVSFARNLPDISEEQASNLARILLNINRRKWNTWHIKLNLFREHK